ncbi:hypothetical protein HPB49_011344 [Dermacentor silvarum]|uniref:Uncharacterized protein n=1 Tax=Dermacentor silvarum TaxID=543639 RepID=A0ACB8D5D9_DERSI|nr:hypothetical protein HPB49_011344 [Dermacentor silvarum]
MAGSALAPLLSTLSVCNSAERGEEDEIEAMEGTDWQLVQSKSAKKKQAAERGKSQPNASRSFQESGRVGARSSRRAAALKQRVIAASRFPNARGRAAWAVFWRLAAAFHHGRRTRASRHCEMNFQRIQNLLEHQQDPLPRFALSDNLDDSGEGDMEPLNQEGAQPEVPLVPLESPRAPPAGEVQQPYVHSSFKDKWCLWSAIRIGFGALFCLVFAAELYIIWRFRAAASSSTKLMSPWLRWEYRDGDVRAPRILVWTDPPSEISEARLIDVASGIAASKDSTAEHWTSCHFITDDPYDVPEQCAVTYDRRLLMESDLIVFHADRVNASDLPRKRGLNQLWVFLARPHRRVPYFEFDVGIRRAVRRFTALFNDRMQLFSWTMGSREDADVNVAYKSLRNRSTSADHSSSSAASVNPSYASPILRSRKDAAWIASDCERERFREEQEKLRSLNNGRHYVNAVHIHVQVLPNCGAGQCDSLADCVAQVAKKFKFILVAGTPACFQSVHDLVYEAFEHDLVPIVLPSPNITLKVPPKSVVSVADMPEPGRLHAHLRTLLDDPAEYERYFAWKQNFTVSALDDELCSLCEAFQKENLTVPAPRLDIREWWEVRARCEATPSLGIDVFSDALS